MDLVEKARKHWFVGIISIAIICISITWVVAIEILVKLRDFKIEQQKEEIIQLKDKITQLEDEIKRLEEEIAGHVVPPETVKPEGKINRPFADDDVTLEFPVEVEIIRYNPNKYYYLVNEVENLWWPKFQINPSAIGEHRKIYGLIVEAGNPPHGIFHLLLIEVDEDKHQEIRRWLIGDRLLGIPRDGTVLNRIRLRLKG
jgi:hypothetical protein